MSQVTSARENRNGNRAGYGPAVPSIPMTDDRAGANGDQSIGSLVRDALTQFSTLLRAEIELAKSEIASEVKKGLKGSVFFIVALTVLLLSLPFFFYFLGELLAVWLPRWAAFLIVFGIMLVAAAGFAFLGYRKFRAVRAPQRTISSVKDTAAALRPSSEPEPPAIEARPSPTPRPPRRT